MIILVSQVNYRTTPSSLSLAAIRLPSGYGSIKVQLKTAAETPDCIAKVRECHKPTVSLCPSAEFQVTICVLQIQIYTINCVRLLLR